MKILLASNSPRRRELLGLLDVDFEIVNPRKIDEVYPDTLPVDRVAPYLSALKADAYADIIGEDEILLTADTVVICDSRILGKPADENDARQMLSVLSDKTHEVVTGVTLISKNRRITFSETTKVTFDRLSSDEIDYYVSKYKPLDKAGAYGIQEWIGCTSITRIDGCFYNVMGLPLHSLFHHLREMS